jgi:hypothetical protein
VSEWLYVALAIPVLLMLFFVGDFMLFVGRSFWYADRPDRNSDLLRRSWHFYVAKWLPTPRIKISGVRASADELDDGTLVAATARWWNELVHRRRRFMTPAAHELGAAEVEAIQATIAPENARLLRASARARAPHDTLSEGCLALSYALTRAFAGGTDTDWLPAPQPITPEHLEQNDLRYDQLGLISDLADVPSEGHWREIELASLWNQIVVKAIRWAYADQVRRWEHAEGRTMGKGIGFGGLTEGRLIDTFSELLFEHGGRFHETECAVYAMSKEDGEEIEAI